MPPKYYISSPRTQRESLTVTTSVSFMISQLNVGRLLRTRVNTLELKILLASPMRFGWLIWYIARYFSHQQRKIENNYLQIMRGDAAKRLLLINKRSSTCKPYHASIDFNKKKNRTKAAYVKWFAAERYGIIAAISIWLKYWNWP